MYKMIEQLRKRDLQDMQYDYWCAIYLFGVVTQEEHKVFLRWGLTQEW